MTVQVWPDPGGVPGGWMQASHSHFTQHGAHLGRGMWDVLESTVQPRETCSHGGRGCAIEREAGGRLGEAPLGTGPQEHLCAQRDSESHGHAQPRGTLRHDLRRPHADPRPSTSCKVAQPGPQGKEVETGGAGLGEGQGRGTRDRQTAPSPVTSHTQRMEGETGREGGNQPKPLYAEMHTPWTQTWVAKAWGGAGGESMEEKGGHM